MTLNEYQEAAGRTWKGHSDPTMATLHALTGLTGETGEVAELVKKQIWHDKQASGMLSELGDVLYYLAMLAHECGYDLDDVAAFNVQKLRQRYPQGFVVGGGLREQQQPSLFDVGAEIPGGGAA